MTSPHDHHDDDDDDNYRDDRKDGMLEKNGRMEVQRRVVAYAYVL